MTPPRIDRAVPLELAIVLPTLNESGNLAPLIERIDEALAGVIDDGGWEAIIVDDDSPDGTADEARSLAQSDRRIRVIQRIGRRGLSSAAIEGMCATAAPHVAVMDADHQHDPALLPAMLAALRADEADICIASRFAPGASTADWEQPRRERLSGIGNRIARAIMHRGGAAQLTDPMSGYFMLSTNTARTLAPRLSGIGFKVLLDLLATAKPPLRTREFPLAFAARREGESKLDRAVMFDFLALAFDRTLGLVISTRFAMFAAIGAPGVVVHMAVLWVLLFGVGLAFAVSQGLAVIAAMSFNFALNNWLTYRDRRLTGMRALFGGWARFCAACAIGGLANVALASWLESEGAVWAIAALAGIFAGSLWNYALSSRFVWVRF